MRTRRIGKIVITTVTALLLVLTASCAPAVTEEKEEKEVVTPEPGVEWGILEIRVTDPPPADIQSANVTLTNIEVHRVSGNTSGWIPVLDAPSNFDLLDVIGVEKVLGSANVTAGSFAQIRMDVVEVVGETTDNISYTAEVPSDKLKIVGAFDVGAGKVTVLTLDFDGEKSLVRTGSDNFLFRPVVKLSIVYKGEIEWEREQEHEQGETQGQKREEEKEHEKGADELKLEGTIVAIDGSIWKMIIEGETRTVDVSEAEIKGEPAKELQAKVEGTIVDGTIVASEVEIKETE